MDILTHNEFEKVHDDSLQNHYAFVDFPVVLDLWVQLYEQF
jgi:hypothetical protein